MTALSGSELVLVQGITSTGLPGGTPFNTTTQAIANLGGGGGSGITRSVSSVSTPTNAAAAALTDYVYLVSGTTTVTLPTAVGNTNLYTIKRTGSGTVTVATTSAQTIDGSATAAINVQYQSLNFISDNSNWNIT